MWDERVEKHCMDRVCSRKGSTMVRKDACPFGSPEIYVHLIQKNISSIVCIVAKSVLIAIHM